MQHSQVSVAFCDSRWANQGPVLDREGVHDQHQPTKSSSYRSPRVPVSATLEMSDAVVATNAGKTDPVKEREKQPHDSPPPVVVIRLKDVITRTGLSRSAVYDRLDPDSKRHDPSFPSQIRLGASGRAVGWISNELDGWLQLQVTSRHTAKLGGRKL